MYSKYDSLSNKNKVFHKPNSRNRGHDSSLGSYTTYTDLAHSLILAAADCTTVLEYRLLAKPLAFCICNLL